MGTDDSTVTSGLARRRAALPRKVPVKVEPKVFFANERTYLAWLHMSIILATMRYTRRIRVVPAWRLAPDISSLEGNLA